MKAIFADTYFYFALLSEHDQDHERARELGEAHTGDVVTTAWVLTELADGLSAAANRGLFVETLELLRNDPRTLIVEPTSALFDAGVELYAARPDKDWSLTDCISFVVMQEQGIEEAFTADHHFEQAGFRALLA